MSKGFLRGRLASLNKIRGAFKLPPLEVDEAGKLVKGPTPEITSRGKIGTELAVVPGEVAPPKVITAQELGEAILGIRDSMKLQEAEGEVNSYSLTLSTVRGEEEFRHPVTKELKPLITANIRNYGPGTAYFRVNYPSSPEVVLDKGDQISLDFTKAKRKIARVFYYTYQGTMPKVRLDGKF